MELFSVVANIRALKMENANSCCFLAIICLIMEDLSRKCYKTAIYPRMEADFMCGGHAFTKDVNFLNEYSIM